MPGLAFLLVVFLIPIGRILALSVSPGFTFEHFVKVFTTRTYYSVILQTFGMAAAVAVACAILAYPLAFLIAHDTATYRRILLAVVIVPYWMSVLVRSFVWVGVLNPRGVLGRLAEAIPGIHLKLMYNDFAVLFTTTQVLLPMMILPLVAAMRSINVRVLAASFSLGASRGQTFFRVYLPMTGSGVMSGAVLVFIMSLGFYITPALVGGPGQVMISNLIDENINVLLNWPMAAALATTLLAATLVCFYIVARIVPLRTLLGGQFS